MAMLMSRLDLANQMRMSNRARATMDIIGTMLILHLWHLHSNSHMGNVEATGRNGFPAAAGEAGAEGGVTVPDKDERPTTAAMTSALSSMEYAKKVSQQVQRLQTGSISGSSRRDGLSVVAGVPPPLVPPTV